MDEDGRVMTLLEAVLAMDCEVDRVVDALESGAIYLNGNFRDHELEVARQARRRDVPVFDGSRWAEFGA